MFLRSGVFTVCVFVCVCVSVCVCCSDVRRVGVNLAGHQKKIINSIQEMRVTMMNAPVPV